MPLLSNISSLAITCPYLTIPTHDINPPLIASIPIIFYHYVSVQQCKWGFYDYLKNSLEQAVLTQPDSPIIFASNYNDCNKSSEVLDSWHKDIIKIDSTLIVSKKTKEFLNYTDNLFGMLYHMPDLWSSAAMRFLVLEDIMNTYNFTSVLHVEGDNMLYGDMKPLISFLYDNYPGLAATPLTKTQEFVTASVLWIGNLASIKYFNSYLINLGRRYGTTWFSGAGHSSGNHHTLNNQNKSTTPSDIGPYIASDWDSFIR